MCNGGNGMKLLMCNAIKWFKIKKEKYDDYCIKIYIDNYFMMEDLRVNMKNKMDEIDIEMRKRLGLK